MHEDVDFLSMVATFWGSQALASHVSQRTVSNINAAVIQWWIACSLQFLVCPAEEM
jgi:hypothetical protein